MAEPAPALYFDIWGCRGSRSLVPALSAVGNRTSCYSLLRGSTICVIDAGRGLPALGAAMLSQPRFKDAKRVHVFVSHAHMDHWEGIKDVDWFWRWGNGLEVTIYGCPEALGAIESAFNPPSFVPLQILSMGTTASFKTVALEQGGSYPFDGFVVRTHPLHHYSGAGDQRRFLDTLGFSIEVEGARIAYLSDHEPVADSAVVEREMAQGSDLVIYDSHFQNIADHAYGHGSQEHTARVARDNPRALVIASHHGPTFADERILEGFERHGRGLSNFVLAREGDCYLWDAAAKRFVPVPSDAG